VRSPARLSPIEAAERLQSPWGHEDFSPLTGAPALVVDLCAQENALDRDSRALLIKRLAQLPCPTIALAAAAPSSSGAEIAGGCDVAVHAEDELCEILEAVDRGPLATLALVQLLRHSEGLDIHEGLIAESLVYSMLQAGPEFAAWRERHRERRPPPARAEPAVLAEHEGERLILILNRPERRNAFSAKMRDALVQGLHLAMADPAIGEIVLRGAGPAFCSGGDLDEFGTLPDPATAHAIRSTRNAGRLLAACAKRLRAELHGACVGAGMELPAFAGRVVADPNTHFQLPELSLGLVPGAGGTVSIPRRIGRQRTAWLALTGRRLDVRTALEWGLVDEIGDVRG